MRIPERVCCSRFPVGSMDVRSFARARRVAESATATRRASHIAIAIWILAVAARLVLINQPYVDHWSWRQSDVAAIARNFYEGGFRFAYPQIVAAAAAAQRISAARAASRATGP